MFSTVILVSLFVSMAHCANILAIMPAPFYSHQIAYQDMWKELSRVGHKVTLVTTAPPKDPELVNLTVVDMSQARQLLLGKYSISKTAEDILTMWNWYIIYAQINRDSAEEQLASPELQDLIHNHHKYHFDLLFVESYFPEFLAFSKIYNCPTILVTSVDGHTEFQHAIGNPAHPILNADYASPYHVELSFTDRIVSVVFAMYVKAVEMFHVNPKKQAILEKYFTNLNTTTTIDGLIQNADMMFFDCNPAIQGARAIGPTTQCINTERRFVDKRPLSEDIKKFLDDSPEGVIYVSFGSNVRSEDLNNDTLTSIIETFREVPYKVLWKFKVHNEETLKRVPKNAMVVPWANQELILKHPNIKLFLFQGGLQSLSEATYSYVPVVAIPYFADQFKNARLIEYNEIGLQIERKPHVKKEDLKNAVMEVITNPKYKINMENRGKWAHDTPMTGLEKAVWWTNYVIRHKGTKHLRNPAADIPLYQYLLLDVIAFLVLVLVAVVKCFQWFIYRIRCAIMTTNLVAKKQMKLS